MNNRRKQRLYIFSSIFLGASITVGLIIYALGQNMNLFYTPSEILQGINGVKPTVGQNLRVGGMVKTGTVLRDSDGLGIRFDLYDNSGTVTVIYNGILPDLFREEQGIVAQGKLRNSNTIEAFEVLAKHDETYTPPEIAEKMNTEHSK